MVKFSSKLSTALDELIGLAMLEYEAGKKIPDRTWQAKKQQFSEARNEWCFGERESTVTFWNLDSFNAARRVEWVIEDGMARPVIVEG